MFLKILKNIGLRELNDLCRHSFMYVSAQILVPAHSVLRPLLMYVSYPNVRYIHDLMHRNTMERLKIVLWTNFLRIVTNLRWQHIAILQQVLSIFQLYNGNQT